MKAKRQAYPAKITSQNIILIIVLSLLPILIVWLGAIYALPIRFTLPLAIVLVLIAGSMALWHFGKRRV